MTWFDFQYREAVYRFCGLPPHEVRADIRLLWRQLGAVIKSCPNFATSLTPLTSLPPPAPPFIQDMLRASQCAGTGPMAGVAGKFAMELCRRGDFRNCGVNNGGDLYLCFDKPVIMGLWAGKDSPFNALGLKITPEFMPGAFCSSSGVMGHSYSQGRADLAVVCAEEGALADCTATGAANLIQGAEDLMQFPHYLESTPGVRGGLCIKEGKIALWGDFPELIKVDNRSIRDKIVIHTGGRF